MTDSSLGGFRPLLGLSGAALALVVSQTAASAHVTLATSQAQPSSYYKAVLQVPHGCGSEATQTVRVQIPDGVYGVKPMPKPGWTLATTRGEYAKPYQSHGETIKEGVKEVVWSGGNLSNDNYDEFVFVSFLGGDLKPGQAVYFPTIQQCAKGEARWVELPAGQQSPHDLKAPAPQLRIVADTTTAQAQMDHSGHAGMDMSTPATTGSDTYKAGDLTITAPWTRATPNGAKIGGGYLKITNNGKDTDRLVNASASFAGRVEIHEMSMTDGVMKMRPLPNGLEIKPGETVELKPGGFHMMFMDLKQPFKQGDSLKTTLEFEKAGKVDVSFTVNAVGAGAGQQHQH